MPKLLSPDYLAANICKSDTKFLFSLAKSLFDWGFGQVIFEQIENVRKERLERIVLNVKLFF